MNIYEIIDLYNQQIIDFSILKKRFLSRLLKPKEFFEELSVFFEPKHYEILKVLLKNYFEVFEFAFPIVSKNVGYINKALLAVTPFTKTSSNIKRFNDTIGSILGSGYYVLFKNPDFEGKSFTLSMLIAKILKKDISSIAISAEVDQAKQIYDVEFEKEKLEIAKKEKIPLILKSHVEDIETATCLVNNILKLKKLLEGIEESQNIPDKELIIGDSFTGKTYYALSVALRLISEAQPVIYTKNPNECEKANVYRIIDDVAYYDKALEKFNIVISRNYSLANHLKDHKLKFFNTYKIDLKFDNLYDMIDKFIRRYTFKPSDINKLVNTVYFYKDGLPVEKFKTPPDFLYEQNKKLLFYNELVRDYFVARYFVEKKKVYINSYQKRLVVFHPEFTKINKKLQISIIKELVNSDVFRKLSDKEHKTLMCIIKKLNIKEIMAYETAKLVYSKAKYKKALEIASCYNYEKLNILKANICLDLWALEDLKDYIESLDLSIHKKYGMLSSYYLKFGDFQKAIEYASKKILSNKNDIRNYSDLILALAYKYRISGLGEKKLTKLFEKINKNMEYMIYCGRATNKDRDYLFRNFSYSLLQKPYLKENFNNYAFLINKAYITKDKELALKLADKSYSSKEPLEYVAALCVNYLLTNDALYMKLAQEYFDKLLFEWNAILSSINKKSCLISFNPKDIKSFFINLVYIQ
ncbi:MAG: hypothetical protein ACP5QF_07905 [Desulfurella sp.]|jgi:hypothetical protein|uniref:hypothetical protein n=1 Tax=Desulfurella sp. TaxID=1962857 RepID=UPI003D0F3103